MQHKLGLICSDVSDLRQKNDYGRIRNYRKENHKKDLRSY